MTQKDGLAIGDRMKRYERTTQAFLTKRVPVIIRIDGRAFHTITRRRFKRDWSREFVDQMAETAAYVMSDIQGCNMCYSQSDEVSFLLTDYKTIRTHAWFDYEINKLVSISASRAAGKFSQIYGSPVEFDSRAFNIAADDVCNYFIWRQVDATRNAIQMAGREHFSHTALHKMNCNEIQEKLFQEKQINFNDYPVIRKRGFCIVKDTGLDENIPIFTQDREYIEKFVNVRED